MITQPQSDCVSFVEEGLESWPGESSRKLSGGLEAKLTAIAFNTPLERLSEMATLYAGKQDARTGVRLTPYFPFNSRHFGTRIAPHS